jgi:beta-phosphoglucomutase-like phosphatase (HAD superfamily)
MASLLYSPEVTLLDLDGTLLESPGVYKQVAEEMCLKYGLPFNDEIFAKHGGKHLLDWLDEICDDATLKAQYVDDYRMRVRVLLDEKAQWKDGAPEFLRELKAQDRPRAIATTTSRQTFDVLNKKFGITNLVPDVITSSETPGRCKPNPLCIHLARMAVEARIQKCVDPSICAYMGDGEYDVVASERAGVMPVLYPNGHTHEDAFRPSAYVIRSYTEYLEMLS